MSENIIFRRPFASFFALTLLTFAINIPIVVTHGFPGRFEGLDSMNIERVDYRDHICLLDGAEKWDATKCAIRHGAGHGVLVWGDSYAAHYVEALGRDLPRIRGDLLQYTRAACPPILSSTARTDERCTDFNQHVFEVIAQNKIDFVVLAGRWEAHFKGQKIGLSDLTDTISRLKALGVQVLVIGQSPVFSFQHPEEYFYRSKSLGAVRGGYRAPVDLRESLNQKIEESVRQGGGRFFDPSKIFCEGQLCLYKLNDKYLVADNGHLTKTGSEMVIEKMLQSSAFE